MTSRSTGRRVPASFAFALVLLAAPVSHAQEDHAEGMRLFLQKGNCQACHGWAGDGRKMDNQMPDGSNLRESKLDRAAIILTIKCGRPGRSMPAFDRLAYSDGRCYGMTQPCPTRSHRCRD
jgi:mono/diheme cytochrome c family protein